MVIDTLDLEDVWQELCPNIRTRAEAKSILTGAGLSVDWSVDVNGTLHLWGIIEKNPDYGYDIRREGDHWNARVDTRAGYRQDYLPSLISAASWTVTQLFSEENTDEPY
jgi:hypothetical protein